MWKRCSHCSELGEWREGEWSGGGREKRVGREGGRERGRKSWREGGKKRERENGETRVWAISFKKPAPAS